MALGDDFTSALEASNNTLTQTPGLAVDAATSGDPANAGLLLSHTAQVQAAADAANNDQQQNSGGGLLHHLMHDVTHIPGASAVGHAIGTGAQWLAKPLQEVQADYRYVHEVFARQGFVPGLLATLGVAAGGTAGFMVGGFAGAALGASLAGELERGSARAGLLGTDQQATAEAADASNTHISFGRDVANALSNFPGLNALQNTSKGWGKVVSGLGDATFDLGLDPTMKAGSIYKDLKYGSDVAVARWSPARKWLGNTVTDNAGNVISQGEGLRISSPEAVESLRHSTYWGAGYRRALSQLAGMNGGDIVARYPELRGLVADTKLSDGTVIQGLASAGAGVSDKDEAIKQVHQVFMHASANAEMAQRLYQGTLPSRSLMRTAASNTAEWMRNLDPNGTLASQRGLVLPSKTGSGFTDWRAPAVVSAPAKALTGDLAGAKQDVAGAVARKVRTYSGFLPYAMDPDTLKLSSKTFDPMNPESLLGVYRAFKYSMGEQRARELTDQFAQAQTLGMKKKVWSEGMLEMLKASGLPDDPELLRQVSGQVRQIGSGPGSELYGYGLRSKADVSKVELDNGTIDDMALWTDQRGQFAFPDFSKVKQATRALHGWMANNGGRADEWIAHAYTNSFFKPLALVNAGFGLRVAAAELIPSLLKYGPMNQVTAKINASAAKVNYRLDADRLTGQADNLMQRAQIARANGATSNAQRYEQQANDLYGKASTRVEHYHVLAAASKLLGGAQKFLGVSDEDRDLAYRIVMANEGHIVKGVSDTSHGNTSFYLPDDPNLRNEAVIHYGKQWLTNRGLAPSGNYAAFAHDSQDFAARWHLELQKRSQNLQAQNVAKDLLDAHNRGMSVDEAYQHALAAEAQRIKDDPAYAYDRKVLGRHEVASQTPEQMAADRADAMQGLLVGRDGTFHGDVANQIANAEKPTLADLNAINEASRPEAVVGEIYAPWLGNGKLDSVVSMGFRRLVDPVINNVSREPIYFNAVKREWENLRYLRENGLDETDALRLAQYRGSLAMLPQIHNTDLRTQFHSLARNFLPFFFAQQQAYQRAAYLIGQNPNALRGLQLIQHGLNDPGFVQSDGSGNRYLMLPIVGELGKGFQNGAAALGLPLQAGLPVSMSGSMESLRTVLPEMDLPGVSPLVSVPMNAFDSLSHEVQAPWANSFSGLTKEILGDRGYSASFFDSVMPNQMIRNLVMAASPDEQSRSWSNAMASAIASAYYHGQVPAANASPMEQQAFLDRIRNNARSLFMLKAVVGLVSPLSPSVAQEDPGFRDEFYALVKKDGYSKAIDEFMQKHGSKSISYTVAHTDPVVGGASLPYTQKAIDWINQHEDLIHSPLSTGAAFLVPQDPAGGDPQKISNEYLKMHLRERRTPDDFLNAIYVAAGNSAIHADKTKYDAALKAAEGDSATTQALRTAWSDHLASMQVWNPVWFDNWASPARTDLATQAYEQLQVLFSSGRAPAGEQTTAVATLMDAYQTYVQNMAGLATQRSQFANSQRQDLKDQWSAFLDSQMKSNPQLAPVIRAVFSKLPDTPAAASRLDTGVQALQTGQVSPLDMSGNA